MGEGQNPICSKLGITKKKKHRKVTRYTGTKQPDQMAVPHTPLLFVPNNREMAGKEREKREGTHL